MGRLTILNESIDTVREVTKKLLQITGYDESKNGDLDNDKLVIDAYKDFDFNKKKLNDAIVTLSKVYGANDVTYALAQVFSIVFSELGMSQDEIKAEVAKRLHDDIFTTSYSDNVISNRKTAAVPDMIGDQKYVEPASIDKTSGRRLSADNQPNAQSNWVKRRPISDDQPEIVQGGVAQANSNVDISASNNQINTKSANSASDKMKHVKWDKSILPEIQLVEYDNDGITSPAGNSMFIDFKGWNDNLANAIGMKFYHKGQDSDPVQQFYGVRHMQGFSDPGEFQYTHLFSESPKAARFLQELYPTATFYKAYSYKQDPKVALIYSDLFSTERFKESAYQNALVNLDTLGQIKGKSFNEAVTQGTPATADEINNITNDLRKGNYDSADAKTKEIALKHNPASKTLYDNALKKAGFTSGTKVESLSLTEAFELLKDFDDNEY